MKNLNQVTIQGNLGNTPEVLENEHGKITYFDIANTKSFKNSEGEKVEITTWVNVKAKGSTADYLAKYFEKGDRVVITGELTSKVQEIEGKKYTFTSILLKEIYK